MVVQTRCRFRFRSRYGCEPLKDIEASAHHRTSADLNPISFDFDLKLLGARPSSARGVEVHLEGCLEVTRPW